MLGEQTTENVNIRAKCIPCALSLKTFKFKTKELIQY